MLETAIEWTPLDAAILLTGGWVNQGNKSVPAIGWGDELESLHRRIREAILVGHLAAESRGKPERRHPQYFLKPIDVIKWALDQDIDVPAEYRKWYSDITKPKRKTRQHGPRDSSRDRVIVAMAKALGYLPAEGKKAAQGRLQAILDHDDKLDAGTVKKVVQAALEASQEND